MGQKINPIGLRLGINRGWDSTWFAKKKDFGRYLIEDFKIRNYIKKNIVNSLLYGCHRQVNRQIIYVYCSVENQARTRVVVRYTENKI